MSSMNVFWQIESEDVEKRDQVKNLLNSKAKKLRYKDYLNGFFSPISALAYIVYVKPVSHITHGLYGWPPV